MVDGSSPSASRDRDRPSNPNAKVDAGEESAASRTARRLLDGIRRDQPGEPHLQTLETIDDHGLDSVRNDRRTAMAFWLNVYNAAAQRLLDRRPNLFESRWRFFRAPAVTIAGIDLSLDDIEHGIMRGNRSKYGLGYLPRLRRTGLGPDVGLSADPRIHFALNCGAASCPAIRSFHPQTVHRTLDAATDASLQETLAYDADRGLVHVPRVCLWFIGDFGGPGGLRSFLRYHGQLLPASKPSLRFRHYDWTKTPGQFLADG